MKVNTDSCILGAYASHYDPKTILDIGTGTGILGLMMAQRFTYAQIDCIELDVLAAQQALDNLKHSKWSNRMRLIQGDVKDLVSGPHKKYDLLISNPPYFEDHLMTLNDKRNLARHNTALGLEGLANSMASLMADSGSIYLVLPPPQFDQFKKLMRPMGFKVFDQLTIFNKTGKPPHRIIGGFSITERMQQCSNLVIWQNINDYTTEFKEMLKDFYLAF